jgi:hypothetical protein
MRQRIPVRRWKEADFAVPLGRKPLAAVRRRRQAQPPAILWQQEGGGYAASLAGNPGAFRGSMPQEPHALKRRNHRPPAPTHPLF